MGYILTLRDIQMLAISHGIETHQGARRLTKMQLLCKLFGPGGPCKIPQ
jgi:hypothetical protein